MLTLPRSLSLTPDQFAQVCAANPEAVLELAADGTLIDTVHAGLPGTVLVAGKVKSEQQLHRADLEGAFPNSFGKFRLPGHLSESGTETTKNKDDH